MGDEELSLSKQDIDGYAFFCLSLSKWVILLSNSEPIVYEYLPVFSQSCCLNRLQAEIYNKLLSRRLTVVYIHSENCFIPQRLFTAPRALTFSKPSFCQRSNNLKKKPILSRTSSDILLLCRPGWWDTWIIISSWYSMPYLQETTCQPCQVSQPGNTTRGADPILLQKQPSTESRKLDPRKRFLNGDGKNWSSPEDLWTLLKARERLNQQNLPWLQFSLYLFLFRATQKLWLWGSLIKSPLEMEKTNLWDETDKMRCLQTDLVTQWSLASANACLAQI